MGGIFDNTEHPDTHRPSWRDLGPRGGVPHRTCRHCHSYVEYRNRLGRWVREHGDCPHYRRPTRRRFP